MNENQNNLNPRKANPTQEQIALKHEMLVMAETHGFKYLMSELQRQRNELLSSLRYAIGNPDLEPSERLQEVYQIACNLDANCSFVEAIDLIICNGSTQEEVNKLQEKI